MDLPNELLLQIISLLNRSDLKSTRLVSKVWNLYSSEFLFDTIYASAQDEDLTVFKEVAQHPTLSKCVSTLEYDCVAFDKTISLSEYVDRLWDQLAWTVHHDHGGHRDGFDSSDPEVNKLVSLLRNRPLSGNGLMDYTAEAHRLCLGMHFIQEGYADWKRRAEQLMKLTANNGFEKDMIHGLSNLTRLNSVRLNGSWPYLNTELSSSASLPKVRYGSPLARQWNVFQAFPLNWRRVPNTITYGCLRGMAEFYEVAWVLARAGKQPRKFECGRSIPPTAFVLSENPEISSTCLGLYTNLHRLELDLDSHSAELVRNEPDLREQGNLKGLQWLLGNVTNLQYLRLLLPRDYMNSPKRAKLYRYENVFPADGHWPKLVSFSVQYLSLHMKDFIHLVSCGRMRKLKKLEIRNIELLSGTWEAAIEVLKSWPMDLNALCIDPYSFLWDGSPQRRQFITNRDVDDSWGDYDPGDDADQMTFVEKINQYVSYSRRNMRLRHPCLNPKSPGDAALEYLQEALETCERTGADPLVLAWLGMYIEKATTMYASRKEYLERMGLADEESADEEEE